MPAMTIVLDVERDGFSSMRGLESHDELIHLAEGAKIEVGALEAGMASGKPSAAFCFKRQAADRPAGPAPTMTTSNSMYSRSTGYLLLKAQQFLC